ncbi:MAG TPA: hypothetical protein VIJ87_16960, partial [Pyrinomonadaceae bacterium]
MTNAIGFYNNGTLDHRAFTMLGLSAKSDDKAIGFFGTGFKYAIATLLRHGCDVQVWTDTRVYGFHTKHGKFRNKEFDFIYYNDGGDERELPFTTHLGANWKLWQAYRELYTNALDEGGGVALIENVDDYGGRLGDICVCVIGDEFVKIYEQHAKYFLNAPALAQSFRMRCVEKIADSDNVV